MLSTVSILSVTHENLPKRTLNTPKKEENTNINNIKNAERSIVFTMEYANITPPWFGYVGRQTAITEQDPILNRIKVG